MSASNPELMAFGHLLAGQRPSPSLLKRIERTTRLHASIEEILLRRSPQELKGLGFSSSQIVRICAYRSLVRVWAERF